MVLTQTSGNLVVIDIMDLLKLFSDCKSIYYIRIVRSYVSLQAKRSQVSN